LKIFHILTQMPFRSPNFYRNAVPGRLSLKPSTYSDKYRESVNHLQAVATEPLWQVALLNWQQWEVWLFIAADD